MIKIVVITLFIGLNSTFVHAQEILPFKDQMSSEKFSELIERESEANEEVDPLEKASKFSDLAWDANKLSNKLGRILFAKALDIASELKNDSMIAVINVVGSIPYINRGEYKEAEMRLESALQYLLTSEDTLQLAKCYTYTAYLERVKGNSYLALENLYKAKALKERVAPLYEMWDITNRLIINYSDLGELDNAISIGEAFLESARHLEKKPTGYHTILRNTGAKLLENGNTEKAKQYILESIPYWMQTGYPKFLAQSFSLLHTFSIEEGDLLLAKSYADSNLIYSTQYNSPNMMSYAHLQIYSVLEKLERTDKLEYHLQRALSLARKSNLNILILEAVRTASKIEEKKGNFKAAFNYQTEADSLQKKIFSEEMATKIKNLEKRMAIERSQKEVQQLSEQNDLKAQNLKKAELIRKYLIGFLVLAVGACLLVFLLLRQRSKNNAVLQEKNETISVALSEKETLLQEIHHRVKNNLQFISSLLGLQTEHVEDEAALDALQEGQDRVQSMALIHQNLYQENNLTGVDVKDYFLKLIQGLFDSYNIYDDQISLALDIEDINLDVDTVIPMGLIVNELISNSLKYAFPNRQSREIEIGMREAERVLHLSVSDNGIGLTNEQIENLGESFGYRLIEAFTKQLKAKRLIDTRNGTSVKFEISKYEVAEISR